MRKHLKFDIYVTRTGLCFKEANSNMLGHHKGCLYLMPSAIDAATGYEKVTAYNPKTKKSRPVAVHQLVAECYLDSEGKRYIDHIDRDKTNNNVNNLRYVSQSENNINTKRSDRALEHYGFRPSKNKREYKRLWAREHYADRAETPSIPERAA